MCLLNDAPELRRRGGLLSGTAKVLKSVTGVLSEFNKCNSLKSAASKDGPKRSLSDSALQARPAGVKQQLTLADVAKHNTPEDAWLVIKNRVYDVSGFGDQHPGGRVLYTYAGKDATDVFSTFHAATTWGQLRALYVGDVVDDEPVPALLADFRELRSSFMQQGLFNSNKLYYVWKLVSTMALLAAAIGLLAVQQAGWGSLALSALLLALFWQQTGWLAHDFLHHQVFTSRRLNNCVGLLLGNVCQGFSIDWWKKKHNTHHAAPNELTAEGKHAVDPDIDTLPLVAWSAEMLEGVTENTHRMLVRLQHYLFFPILAFARLSWCQQSLAHASDLAKVEQRRGRQELLLLSLHYCWYLGAAFTLLPLGKALAFVLLSQMLAGLLLSIVFVQSHNGMEVYSDTKDFVTAQVVSTRDILSNFWNDWFTGGLNYQIEHHLFPTLPRHNLGKVRSAVQALCDKHGLVYESCGMAVGTHRVLRRLAEVAAQA